ncbi:MAG: universal stress protein, partial [Armatimonadota bacterium]
GAQNASLLTGVQGSVVEILGSLLIGAAAGLLMDFVVHRLKRRGEMLTVGLALLLLAGESARLLHMSPLLAGMAAGFTIVNRDRRDVRVFRAINDFEPPMYALFFTLAGAHLHISALAAAGALGAVYALLRVTGKITGANVGARLAKAPPAVRRWLGFALVPQAGVAIGLIFLIQGDEALAAFGAVITPVVLGAVVLSELVGPACARLAVVRAGEAGEVDVARPPRDARAQRRAEETLSKVEVGPWKWERLSAPADPAGHVVFGVSHPATVAGLTRIAVLLAHHESARPLAVRVTPADAGRDGIDAEATRALFSAAKEQARELGVEVATHVEQSASVAAGILAVGSEREARAIVLGHPPTGTRRTLGRVVEVVGRRAECPVIAVRFAGLLHTERILVPFGSLAGLEHVESVVRALAAVGPHNITLLQMMPPETRPDAIVTARGELGRWAEERDLPGPLCYEVVGTEARVDTICKLADSHDLLVMRAAQRGLRRAFFGSLAEDVAQRCEKPVLMVHLPK